MHPVVSSFPTTACGWAGPIIFQFRVFQTQFRVFKKIMIAQLERDESEISSRVVEKPNVILYVEGL